MNLSPRIGSNLLNDGNCSFRVWAPFIDTVEVHTLGPGERTIRLDKDAKGYHEAIAENIPAGTLYKFRLDNKKELPDPASSSQPEGVHGPSQVVDRRFAWNDDDWAGLPLAEYLLYELHVGAFTAEGSFTSIIPHLDELGDLGVTAIELMPVAQFPGTRNWGYDGVYPFAPHNSYGGSNGLKELVNACHQRRLAVVLDVVYNHLGPEGAYLAEFGPYFTDRYKTPWGLAINFDQPYSDEVRGYFIENALSWVDDFHIDGLRLDAIHGIFDFSARHFLRELKDAVQERAGKLNRRIHLLPESDLNDTRVINGRESGGYGMDAQWNDDFHHALHALLTDERSGYYMDFGKIEHLAKAYSEGFVYSGQYSTFRRRHFGNSSRDIPGHRLIVFSQNHDQVGNRMLGDRLSALTDFEALKLAAGVALLSPFIPLLFMGEEYGEEAPFPYFVSHGDPDLIEAVRKGRKEEFSQFNWSEEPPDPASEATFLAAKINRKQRLGDDRHGAMYRFYRELIRLRKTVLALRLLKKENLEVEGLEEKNALIVRRWVESDRIVAVYHFGDQERDIEFPLAPGPWRKLLDSADERWGGPGSPVPARIDPQGAVKARLRPHSFVLFETAEETES